MGFPSFYLEFSFFHRFFTALSPTDMFKIKVYFVTLYCQYCYVCTYIYLLSCSQCQKEHTSVYMHKKQMQYILTLQTLLPVEVFLSSHTHTSDSKVCLNAHSAQIPGSFLGNTFSYLMYFSWIAPNHTKYFLFSENENKNNFVIKRNIYFPVKKFQ